MRWRASGKRQGAASGGGRAAAPGGLLPACLPGGPSPADVALVPGWHSVTLRRALWACRRAGIPVLYRGDTHLGNAPTAWYRPAWTVRTWLLLRLFRGYLSVGQRTRAYLLRFGVSSARLFQAPHCVDNEFFAKSAAPYQNPGARAAVRTSWGLGTDDFVVLF